MRLKKNAFSYLSFFIVALVVSVISITLICDTIDSFNLINIDFNNNILNSVFPEFVSLLILVASICVLLLIRFIRSKIIKTEKSNSVIRLILHVLLVLSILAFGIYFRYLNVLANSQNDFVSSLVHKMMNGEKTGVTNTLQYFYLCFVTFISSFVGIKESIFLWTNLVLEVLASLLVYFSVKKIFGRMPALGSFAGISLLSFSYLNVNQTSGMSLLFFFISLTFCLFCTLIKARYNQVSDKDIHIIWFILLGLVAGFVAYLHIYGLVIYIVMFSMIFIYRPAISSSFEETPEEQLEKYGEVIEYPEFVYDDDYEKEPIWYTNGWPALLFLLFAAASFVGLIVLDAYVYSLDLTNILWENGYLNVLNFHLFNKFLPSNYLLELSILLIIACLGVIAFLFHSSDNLSGLTLGIVTMVPVFVFLKNPESAYTLCFALLGAYVGNGLDFVFFRQIRASVASNNSDKEEIKNNDEEDIIINNISLNEEMNKPKEKEINFIENVLPVPKKHVKKELDYAFEPSEEKMKFDIEISDNDDFDIL